jgi:hypothetical protein
MPQLGASSTVVHSPIVEGAGVKVRGVVYTLWYWAWYSFGVVCKGWYSMVLRLGYAQSLGDGLYFIVSGEYFLVRKVSCSCFD